MVDSLFNSFENNNNNNKFSVDKEDLIFFVNRERSILRQFFQQTVYSTCELCQKNLFKILS